MCCDSTSCKLQVAMIVRVVVALREDAVVGGEIAQTAVSAFLRMPCNINVFFVLGSGKSEPSVVRIFSLRICERGW